MSRFERKLVPCILTSVLMVLSGCGGDDVPEGEPCEGLEGIGAICSVGAGECIRMGVMECAEDGASLVCDTQPGNAASEICDGLDNDCDGVTDEDLATAPANNQEGVCSGTVKTCLGVEGWEGPNLLQLDGYEADEVSCDGLDNDCDGVADEDLTPPDTEPCPSEGICAGLSLTCTEGAWVCGLDAVVGYEETETACDGLDNDCDGAVDEDLTPPDTKACPSVGVCLGVVEAACQDGSWVCDMSQAPFYEDPEMTCDGLDNDCDGAIDEDIAPQPADPSCDTAGVCATGVVMACVDGGWLCDYSGVQGWESVETSCDDLDNDCDGVADEGWTCEDNGCAGLSTGSLKCTAPLGGSGTPAVDGDGTLYINADSPTEEKPVLAAINPTDCSVLWEFVPPFEDYIHALSPAVRGDGRIIFPCASLYSDVKGQVYIVNPDGSQHAVFELPEGFFPTATAVDADDNMYFGNRHCCGDFYAYDSDGSLKWSLDTGGSEFDGMPAIGPDGTVYAGTWKFNGSPEEKVYAITDNGASGQVLWEFAPPENSGEYDTSGIMVNAAPALDGQGHLYVGILGRLGDELATTLYCLNAATGAKQWDYTVWGDHAGLNNSVVIGADETIYFISGHFGDDYGDPTTLKLHAVDPAGAALWANPFAMLGFTWDASPAIGADGNLYVATLDTLYCVNGQDGTEEWSFAFEGAAQGTTIGYDGSVYFLTGAALYALCSESGGLADSAWPKGMHGSKNTCDVSAAP